MVWRVYAWIAQLCSKPAVIAMAVPVVPSTAAGGVDWPWLSRPQQTTLPVPAWIAQLCNRPAAIELAVPEMPSTAVGGVDCPWAS